LFKWTRLAIDYGVARSLAKDGHLHNLLQLEEELEGRVLNNSGRFKLALSAKHAASSRRTMDELLYRWRFVAYFPKVERNSEHEASLAELIPLIVQFISWVAFGSLERKRCRLLASSL
jgi:hypothetical protein